MAERRAGETRVPSQPRGPGLVAGGMLGRYRLLEELGSGGMGVVFKAQDTQRGDVVALKTLLNVKPATLLRLKNEFRSVANISHRNLVTLYELGCDGDVWYYTMEYIPGRSLSAHLTTLGSSTQLTDSTVVAPSEGQAPAPPATLSRTTERRRAQTHIGYGDTPGGDSLLGPEGPDDGGPLAGLEPAAPGRSMPLSTIRHVFRELALGIGALHRAGKLHRDIKPANVMVAENGRVVVLDFGLIAERSGADALDHGALVGTPAYMSPEQASGQPVTEASDWYAFGVMLYEALTGEPPFYGHAAQLLRKKTTSDAPVVPASVEAPADLRELCWALLNRDPTLRPRGSDILEQAWATELSSPGERAAEDLALIGREPQMEALWQAFKAVASETRVVNARIRGGSGMGKSALLDAFLTQLRQLGDVVVLAGRCYEQESVPYKALDAVVDALARHMAGKKAPAQAVSPAMMRDLSRAFPVFLTNEAIPGVAPAVDEGQPEKQELRRRAFRALKSLLRHLSLQKTLVISIDDIHWGDEDSGLILRELVSPPDAPRVLLVFSFRPEEGEASPVLMELQRAEQELGNALLIKDIPVDPLTSDQALRLAAQLTSRNPTDELAISIAAESGGNPFFLERLARHALTGTVTSLPSQPRDAKVEDLVLRQMQDLPDSARQLLEAVAVAGRPVPKTVAARAAGLIGTERNAWASLRSMNLVRARGPRDEDAVETYHDRIREAVARHLPATSTAVLHGRLAESYETAPDTDPEIPAGHFLAAGNRAKAGHYSLLAADGAASKLAFVRAAELYRQAMSCLPDDHDLAVKCGDALVNAGRCAESAPMFLAAAAHAPAERAFALKTRAAEQLLVGGRIDDGLAVLRPLLAQAKIKYPKTPLRALFGIIGQTTLLRFLRNRPSKPNRTITPLQRARIDVTWAAGKGLGSADILRGGYYICRSTVAALQAHEPKSIARGLAHIGLMTVSRARPVDVKRGMQLIAQAQSIGEQLGDPYSTGFAQVNVGTAHMTLGQWKAAREHLETGLATLESKCTGVSWECSFARACLVNVLRCLGELEQLSLKGGQWLRSAKENGDLFGAIWIRLNTSPTLIAADDPAAASAQIDEARASCSTVLFTPQHMLAVLLAAECDLYRGDPGSAWRRLDEIWTVANRSFALGWQIMRTWALQVRAGAALAMIAVGAADRKRLLDFARGYARRLDKECPRPYVKAAATVVRAGLAGVEGNRQEVARLLGLAADHFREAGMALHAASADWRRAALLESQATGELRGRAEQVLRRHGIRAIDRWASMYLPGVPG